MGLASGTVEKSKYQSTINGGDLVLMVVAVDAYFFLVTWMGRFEQLDLLSGLLIIHN